MSPTASLTIAPSVSFTGERGRLDSGSGSGTIVNQGTIWADTASRTIEVTITPAKQYQPASITVAPGEVVTFKVTNAARELHEFVVSWEQFLE